MKSILAISLLLTLANTHPTTKNSNKLTILHTNDIHAHFDQFNKYGTDCSTDEVLKNVCYGGISRIFHLVNEFRAEKENVLFFDAGDQFQGTLFFKTFKADIITEWMNDVKYDLMTIGNHEFDEGEEYLSKFLKSLNFPIVSANINMNDANFLRKSEIVKPYNIFPEYSLGVIGYITKTTSTISLPAKNIEFYDPIDVVQGYIDELHAKGIKRIVCLSHNGYEEDKQLASRTRGISLIVGGHSHSLLLSDVNKRSKGTDEVVGTYPSPVKNLDGKTTYVVQAHRFGDYLGNVDLEFDDNDNLISLKGAPILLDQTVKQDPYYEGKVQKWKSVFVEKNKEVLTISNTVMEMRDCFFEECVLDNLVTDAMLEQGQSIWGDEILLSMTNVKGVRVGVGKGPITVGTTIEMLPYGNTLAKIQLSGSEILEVIEREYLDYKVIGAIFPSPPRFSGLFYKVDLSRPVGKRVFDVKIKLLNGRKIPFEVGLEYPIVTASAVAAGVGTVLSPSMKRPFDDSGEVLEVGLQKYLRKFKILERKLEGRIVFI